MSPSAEKGMFASWWSKITRKTVVTMLVPVAAIVAWFVLVEAPLLFNVIGAVAFAALAFVLAQWCLKVQRDPLLDGYIQELERMPRIPEQERPSSTLRRVRTNAATQTSSVGIILVGVGVFAALWVTGFVGFAASRVDRPTRDSLAVLIANPARFTDTSWLRALGTQLRAHTTRIAHTFDTLTHGQADYNVISAALGTRGVVAPARNLHNTERWFLKRGNGRILWQVNIASSAEHPNQGYEPLNLPEGLSWILAYNYVPADSAARERYENDPTHRHEADPPNTELMGFADALIIPADTSMLVRRAPRQIAVKRHFGYFWNRPLARFRGPGDHHLWGDCGSHGCCEM